MGTPQGISISLTKLTIVWDDLCKKSMKYCYYFKTTPYREITGGYPLYKYNIAEVCGSFEVK